MNKQEHLLTVFAEELGELATEILALQKHVHKSLRFGIDDNHPHFASNRDRIEEEWQDVLGCIEKLREVEINIKPDIRAINAKISKIEKYLTYSKTNGTLSD